MTIRFIALILFLAVPGFAAFSPISPAYEGVYTISLKCPPSDQGDSECRVIEKLDRLVVVGVGGSAGVQLSIPDPRLGSPYFVFAVKNLTDEGAMLEGDSFDWGARPAEFHLDISEAGELSGWIGYAHFDGAIEVQGKRGFSTEKLYGNTESYSLDDIEGSYLGKYDRLSGKLSIRRRLLGEPNRFTVSFTDSTYNLRFNFLVTDLDSERGVIQMVNADMGHFLKWTVRLSRTNEGKVKLEGRRLSSNIGEVGALSFTSRR